MFSTPDEAEQAFYDALARADIDGLMRVWASDEEEIICVHPGSLRWVGHRAVRQSWEAILKQGPLHIETSRCVRLQLMMVATHTLVEQIRIETPEQRGRFEYAYCYATNVFHKGPTGWRMIMHHASAAPERVGAADMHDKPGTLH
jgi:ketosteroid isomerase-like protein